MWQTWHGKQCFHGNAIFTNIRLKMKISAIFKLLNFRRLAIAFADQI